LVGRPAWGIARHGWLGRAEPPPLSERFRRLSPDGRRIWQPRRARRIGHDTTHDNVWMDRSRWAVRGAAAVEPGGGPGAPPGAPPRPVPAGVFAPAARQARDRRHDLSRL